MCSWFWARLQDFTRNEYFWKVGNYNLSNIQDENHRPARKQAISKKIPKLFNLETFLLIAKFKIPNN